MLLLRELKIDPTLKNKLRWIILLEVVGSTKYSDPTPSRYEDNLYFIVTLGILRLLIAYCHELSYS